MIQKKIYLILFLIALFDVLGSIRIMENTRVNHPFHEEVDVGKFRSDFLNTKMMKEKDNYPLKYKKMVENVKKEAKYFPVPESSLNSNLKVTFINSWMQKRTYGGDRGHEGTDLMASENTRGRYPVLSICDGVITNIGWIDKGGYRLGISGKSGLYYYYAHLDSYANVKKGQFVYAGQLLGFMGDSGYGKEGTTGKFDVHLHIGIYYFEDEKEYSLNPYYLLKFLEKHKLKYAYL